ncbi:hypothetical protein MJO29_014764 [Puccinia striiformis f. sp. tritici]|nr:hypothetical protein MJO29_014764 [Puccinia striiformis f. sp. tritici]
MSLPSSLSPSLPQEPPAEVVKWELLTNFESFRTFIDHGCTLDPHNYPIHPNGDTVFVKIPEDTVTNFGSVGFTKTTGTEHRSKGIRKIARIYCLGALVCDVESCMWIGSPPTGRNAVEAYLASGPKCKGAAGRCPGNVVWDACNGTTLRFDFHLPSGWGLLRHRGIHKHAWPEAKKPDKLSRETLKDEIVKNPSAGAFKLKMGQVNSLDDPIVNVTDIHGSFVNADRLRYYRQLLLRELNIVPDKLGGGVGDKFIMDMFQWNRRGLLVISCGFQEEDKHFTFQSKWMADQLLARDENNEVRWIPVQWLWIRGLSSQYYKIHFSVLLQQMVRPKITLLECNLMARQVVDFSLAQVKGFKDALREVFGIHDPIKLDSMVKGCHQHFRAQKSFQFKFMSLLDLTVEGGLNHKEKLDELHCLFPRAKRWLDWWTMSDIQSMLFPSRRPMLDDSPDGIDGLPDSTNAIESMHCVYYMISSGKKSLMVGMVELYSYVNVLEEEFNVVMCGVSVEYGSQTKMQVNVSQSIGWAKPTKRKYVNDGRPPDTTNVDRNPYSKYQSYCRSEEEHLTNQCWMSAAMESLFALYNPLWLRNATGKGLTLFHHLVSHFGSRTTFNLTKTGRIKTILTNGQSKLFKICKENHQASFVPGCYASCDFFLELLLDPKRNPIKALTGLFEVVEHRSFSCSSAPTTACVPAKSLPVTTIVIHERMFEDHQLSYAQVQDLINLWSLEGITNMPGLTCKCVASPVAETAKPKSKSKRGRSQTKAPEALPSLTLFAAPKDVELVSENSRLAFKDNLPPQHLYFFNEVTSIKDKAERTRYMGAMDWPAKLMVAGHSYTLFSHGFWSNLHYWCKVIRAGEGGATRVWLHDDMQNAGNARLVNKDCSAIGGCQPGTSWLFYTRSWTASEEHMEDNPASKQSIKENQNNNSIDKEGEEDKDLNSEPDKSGGNLLFSEDEFVDDFDNLDLEGPDKENEKVEIGDLQENPPAPTQSIKLKLKISQPALVVHLLVENGGALADLASQLQEAPAFTNLTQVPIPYGARGLD